jgi:hypothetical protein
VWAYGESWLRLRVAYQCPHRREWERHCSNANPIKYQQSAMQVRAAPVQSQNPATTCRLTAGKDRHFLANN